MSEIMRYEVNEEWAYSGIVEAGDFIFLSFCEGNVGIGCKSGCVDERPVEYTHHGEGVQTTLYWQISGKENHFHRICEQRRCRRSSNTNRRNSL